MTTDILICYERSAYDTFLSQLPNYLLDICQVQGCRTDFAAL